MQSEFIPKIIPAESEGIIPLIVLFGLSGGGKSRSALIMARGMVGPKGRIVLVDTENGRGSIFANKIPGGYEVIRLDGPFTPQNYLKCLHAAQDAKADIIVFDSGTHEWNGEGGILEMQEAELQRMAGEDFRKRESCKMAAWIKPKAEHARFIRELLRAKIPVIFCLRGKEKTHMVKEDGKTKVITDDFSTPIYDADFFFEALITLEAYQKEAKGGFTRVVKITHEDLWEAIPKENEQIDYKHGETIMKWCRSVGGTKKAEPKADPQKPATGKPAVSKSLAAKKKELWELTDKKHLGDPKALHQWLWDEAILPDTETLENISEERLDAIISKARAKLATVTT
jgi:hypothetical protein